MEEDGWKKSLSNFLEDLRIIEECKGETPENFNQFCEFIAEPSFESLSEELRKYGIKSEYKIKKRKWISFEVKFPKSRIDNFHYIILLPRNAVELKLKLRTRGRRTKKSLIEEKVETFMKDVLPSEILKLPKEDLILDVIKHYRNFSYEILTKTE
jgi:guanylate kinase